MTEIAYFDRKAFLRLGMEKHAVDALETSFNRSGGTSIVIIDQAEMQAMIEYATQSNIMLEALKNDVSALGVRVETIRSLVISENPHVEALKMEVSELQRKIEVLEAFTL